MQPYQILAFYHFTSIEDPEEEVRRHHEFLRSLDVRARIYIARNGINGQMSLGEKDVETYINWLKSDPRFSTISFKMDSHHEHVFPKVTVKVRPELVAMGCGCDLDPKKGGEHVSPEKWKEMLENRDENTLVVDVRNEYESRIGHFEGAECPQIQTFREFPTYAEELRQRRDPQKTKIMMYCTGGIRCEIYSVLLKDKGFEQVYQLEGGVINYGHQMGNKYWKGSLFVFDDRLAVPISATEEHKAISHCAHCETFSDVFYNCANMDCNELFLACQGCAEKFLGCCSSTCLSAERRRPYEKAERPKPFRKWYQYLKTKR